MKGKAKTRRNDFRDFRIWWKHCPRCGSLGFMPKNGICTGCFLREHEEMSKKVMQNNDN